MSPGTVTYILNMVLTGTSTSRYWNIRVAQIPCGTAYTAPVNCLQWFTAATGTITSFNYQFSATPLIQKLANQDYTICIRTNSVRRSLTDLMVFIEHFIRQGFCGIGYSNCTDVPTGTPVFLLGTQTAASEIDSACTNDWIQIPCAVNQQNSGQVQSGLGMGIGCATKICGSVFSSLSKAVTSTSVFSEWRCLIFR